MDKIKVKIDFWIELWEDLINNFLDRSYGLTLYSPHFLIDDIISEIEENNFSNSDNKKFFYKKISEYFDNDEVIAKNLKSQFKILRNIFNTKRVNYIHETAKEIKSLFQGGLYFDTCLEIIIDLLTSDKEISSDFINSINYLTQGLIVEYIKRSYSIEDIKKFPKNIFDDYSLIRGGDILITDFPHGIESKKYISDSGEFNQAEFNKEIIRYLSEITVKERLEKLSYYYYKRKQRAQYIFLIEGLKGDVDIKIGDVTFYSPNKKRFIKQDNTKEQKIDFENLQRFSKSKEKFVQAAVEVDYLMPKSSLSVAITKLESSLDFISCYFNLKTELYFNNSIYVVVGNDGAGLHSSMGRDKRKDSVLRFHDSLNLTDVESHLKKLSKYSFLLKNSKEQSKSISKITNALHWYRKAEQSVKEEDKILSYWIAMESLFNLETDIRLDILNDSNKRRFHLIQETISAVELFVFIYDMGWELYRHYEALINNPFVVKELFPKALVKKAQLNVKVGDKIYLKNFVESLRDIKKYETNLFILNKIDSLIDFYENSKTAKSIIEKKIEEIMDDVLMIYRFRNLIVHNAYFDNSLLPYFVLKIRDFSGHLIRRLIANYNKERELSDLIVNLHFKKEKFLLDFASGRVDLFKV